MQVESGGVCLLQTWPMTCPALTLWPSLTRGSCSWWQHRVTTLLACRMSTYSADTRVLWLLLVLSVGAAGQLLVPGAWPGLPAGGDKIDQGCGEAGHGAEGCGDADQGVHLSVSHRWWWSRGGRSVLMRLSLWWLTTGDCALPSFVPLSSTDTVGAQASCC
jgi:hypothetical protein